MGECLARWRCQSAVLLLVFAVFLLLPDIAAAQSYPDRPIKIIVPVGPAGSYDIGGADILTYETMMQRYAAAPGAHPR